MHRNPIWEGLIILALAAGLGSGCGPRDAQATTLQLEPLEIAAVVDDPTPEGAILVHTEAGQRLLLPETLIRSEDEPVAGGRVVAAIPAGTARIVAVTGDVVTLETDGVLCQVPASRVPASALRSTFVTVTDAGGTRALVPLEAALRDSDIALVLPERVRRDEVLVVEQPALVGRGVVLASGAREVLMLTPREGSLRLVSVRQVSPFASVLPGSAVWVQPTASGFAVRDWTPLEAGVVAFDRLVLDGVLSDTLADALVLSTPGDRLVVVPTALAFTPAGQRIEVASLQPGTPLEILLPALMGQLLAIDDDIVTIHTPTDVVQIPVALLPDRVSRARVAVLKPNGKVVHVPLVAARNMARAQGAIILAGSVDPARIVRWTPGMKGTGVVIGPRDDDLLVAVAADGGTRVVSIPVSSEERLRHAGVPVRIRSTGDGARVSVVEPGEVREEVRVRHERREEDDDGRDEVREERREEVREQRREDREERRDEVREEVRERHEDRDERREEVRERHEDREGRRDEVRERHGKREGGGPGRGGDD